MHRNNEFITAGQEISNQKIWNDACWEFFKESALFFSLSVQDPQLYLSELVREIQKHPKNLTAHIQRIFLCYRENLLDPLYGALVDFLIVLNKRGKAISRRMVAGAKSKLTDRQHARLTAVINREINDISLIEGNGYSIFCRGLSGSVNLIEKLSPHRFTGSDPLKLARDAVEYSQLEEAMAILENAIDEQPGNRELHEFLLELYRSTLNKAGFEAALARLQTMDDFTADMGLQQSWNQLKDYFDRMRHE